MPRKYSKQTKSTNVKPTGRTLANLVPIFGESTAQYLVDHKVATVRITFSGAGDSSQVDHTNLFDDTGSERRDPPTFVIDSVVEWFNGNESCQEYDWWNNEGGDGVANVNLLTGEITVDYNINIVEQAHFSSKTELCGNDDKTSKGNPL